MSADPQIRTFRVSSCLNALSVARASLFLPALVLAALGAHGGEPAAISAASPHVAASPSAGASVSPTPEDTVKDASFEERLAAAKSVQVLTSILGIGLGDELDAAHQKLDKLTDPAQPPKEEGGDAGEEGQEREEGHKVLWQLASTDYRAIFIIADDKERITAVTGFLRPDKALPFDKIGELAKAPILSQTSVAWDVVRPGQPHFRVVAHGDRRQATQISIFVVPRRHMSTEIATPAARAEPAEKLE